MLPPTPASVMVLRAQMLTLATLGAMQSAAVSRSTLPMLGKGDTVSAMANYCSGASRYCSDPAGGVRGNGTHVQHP